MSTRWLWSWAPGATPPACWVAAPSSPRQGTTGNPAGRTDVTQVARSGPAGDTEQGYRPSPAREAGGPEGRGRRKRRGQRGRRGGGRGEGEGGGGGKGEGAEEEEGEEDAKRRGSRAGRGGLPGLAGAQQPGPGALGGWERFVVGAGGGEDQRGRLRGGDGGEGA